MCVSAGKSAGEIAWRRCEGIGSGGHVVGWLERRCLDTSASVRGQKEKMGVWAVDLVGWRSCVSEGENWLLIVLVLSVKKSCKVISCYRSGGRWWRGTEERITFSEEITHIWSAVDLVMEMWRFGSVDFIGGRWIVRFFLLELFLFELSLSRIFYHVLLCHSNTLKCINSQTFLSSDPLLPNIFYFK